jgi:YidC/Oxa1 family membrane protein insertase
MDFLAPIMLNALILIYGTLAENFGLAIAAFTLLLFLITLPLTIYQQRTMRKSQAQMAELQNDRKYKAIMQKHAKDKRKQQEELMKLYSEKGVNPLSSLAGCLPMLIQLPIWFGMFSAIRLALGNTPLQLFELAKNIHPSISSALIPLNNEFLWLNLGSPERLPLPFLENLQIPILSEGLPILTIVVVITTWLQSKLQMTPTTPDNQGAQMTQSMALMMPIMIGFFVYSSPAGLAIYFVVSNVLRLIQAAIAGQLDWTKLRSSQAAARSAG